jgi:hypothetical protein
MRTLSLSLAALGVGLLACDDGRTSDAVAPCTDHASAAPSSASSSATAALDRELVAALCAASRVGISIPYVLAVPASAAAGAEAPEFLEGRAPEFLKLTPSLASRRPRLTVV